ncbi:hypothetical protein L484_011212 [Morus notabilis]|uniref:Uncharacterized protein n=1 Tax=Morus notabilis TaxID=981085 RepID=W9SKV7_9ROSA|nr:hypothetical protein L484_011212 [Morus notabilis]
MASPKLVLYSKLLSLVELKLTPYSARMIISLWSSMDDIFSVNIVGRISSLSDILLSIYADEAMILLKSLYLESEFPHGSITYTDNLLGNYKHYFGNFFYDQNYKGPFKETIERKEKEDFRGVIIVPPDQKSRKHNDGDYMLFPPRVEVKSILKTQENQEIDGSDSLDNNNNDKKVQRSALTPRLFLYESEDWIERILGRNTEGIKLYGVSTEDPFV